MNVKEYIENSDSSVVALLFEQLNIPQEAEIQNATDKWCRHYFEVEGRRFIQTSLDDFLHELVEKEKFDFVKCKHYSDFIKELLTNAIELVGEDYDVQEILDEICGNNNFVNLELEDAFLEKYGYVVDEFDNILIVEIN